jgi:hypothetical protein
MADYSQLEEDIKKIIELVEKLPEQYRATSFEVLLNAHLKGVAPPVETTEKQPKPKDEVSAKPDLPIDVKAFLMQFTIPDEAIDKLFLRHGTEIRPIYKIPEGTKGTGQIQVALLSALENALKSPDAKFEFSFEHVRELCKWYHKYDTDHFKSVFGKSKRLFVNLSDEEHVELSPDGKSELADLVAELTK